jgi:hypothetical protein
MLAVPVSAVVASAGPPRPVSRQASVAIERALGALGTPRATDQHLFAADSELLDAKDSLASYRYGKRPNPPFDVDLAVVTDHVALASTGPKRRGSVAAAIAQTRAALRHLRPFR